MVIIFFKDGLAVDLLIKADKGKNLPRVNFESIMCALYYQIGGFFLVPSSKVPNKSN